MKVLQCDMKSGSFAKDFQKSLLETGFAVVVNHGIPKEVFDSAYRVWGNFFQSANQKKLYLHDKETQAGYFPMRSEKAKDAKVTDLKEFFHFFGNRKSMSLDTPAYTLDETVITFKQLERLATQLLRTLESVTETAPWGPNGEIRENWPSIIDSSKGTLFRILHYPPLAEDVEDGAVRAAAHEDINLLTLLPSATEPGLEVMDTEGNWHAVETSSNNAIIVNAGDMLQEMTNGMYKSTTHRVVNPSGEAAKKSRYSMPLFLHPHSDVRLSDRYTAGEFLEQRLKELGLK